MNVSEAIKWRFSTRAYLDKPVGKETVYKILDIARFSPSGHNIQPWEVAVVMGKKKQELAERLMEAVKNREPRKYDYEHYTKQLPEKLKERFNTCNAIVFDAKKIDPKKDKDKLLEHILQNFKFFDAPVELIVMTERGIGEAVFLDLGMFAQSIMLAALEFGLASCPKTSIAMYPDIIREVLGIPQNKMIVYGISLGYPDPSAPINKVRMPRDKVEDFAVFYE
ncbi:nitroreductase [Hippea sp. KM1]|uniref:nitroreductase n=1 Tax=Hippea sp. KM1 TaxID=944481 RepID=UPI00046D37EA|nr:nitroreductase [Hippea sp. KM1]